MSQGNFALVWLLLSKRAGGLSPDFKLIRKEMQNVGVQQRRLFLNRL